MKTEEIEDLFARFESIVCVITMVWNAGVHGNFRSF